MKQSSKQGTYEFSETINGKSTWKSATQAIWYYPRYKDWFIGSISKIGTTTAGIHSVADTDYDCPQQVPKDKWKFYDGTFWQTFSSNDINFHCAGKGKLL